MLRIYNAPIHQKENDMTGQLSTLFGIPYPIVGFFCFILALVFMYVLWPKPRADKPPRSFGQNFILHYFHPLAWVLVGMAAFMQARFMDLSIILAGVGVLVFLMFLFTMVRE
jgi:hypothetical protein